MIEFWNKRVRKEWVPTMAEHDAVVRKLRRGGGR